MVVLALAGCTHNEPNGGTGGTGGTAGSSGQAGGTTGAGNSTGTAGSAGTGSAGTNGGGHAGTSSPAGGSSGQAGSAGAAGNPEGGTRGTTGGTSGGAGGRAGGASGQAGGSGGHAGGVSGQAGGTAGGAGGTTLPAGTCLDDMMNGTETGVDCGGSCPACPSYKINAPTTGDTVGSGCAGGPAYMCTRSMLFSPEFKSAEADDFTGTSANPAFVYAVVGHDARSSDGLDSGAGNGCCQCYQLVFTTPKDQVTGLPTPKPMIVQAFNTGVDGSGMDFDIYMGDGGEGSNTAGCMGGSGKMYSAYPSIGQTNNGGIRAQTVSQCSGTSGLSATSIATTSCQSTIASDCAMITSSSAGIQSTTQSSCIESNQPQNLYHLNWNVMAKRIECPTNLTRVTGCQLTGQGLPQADPTAVDSASASGKGFSSGYTTTTMQDCCRPTCAYKPNVSGAASPYNLFYTCDASGNPS